MCQFRHHKLRVLVGGWWRKSNRPGPQDLFLDYNEIPKEPRLFLERYVLNEAYLLQQLSHLVWAISEIPVTASIDMTLQYTMVDAMHL